MEVLISWIGRTDLKSAAKNDAANDPGPVLRLLRCKRFDAVHLLNDIPPNEQSAKEASPAEYISWLADQCGMSRDAIHAHQSDENLRNQYDRAFTFTQQTLQAIYRDQPQANFALLLTPGYPAAQVAMLIAAQTLFDRAPTLYNTFEPRRDRPGAEVEVVQLPFTLSIDAVMQKILHPPQPDTRGTSEAFGAISGASQAIDGARQLASRVARFADVPVLLLGETGTGKELFAAAIHNASPRGAKPFYALNCAAIPAELLESQLFGHVKGSYTGAVADREGAVAKAEGGTIFLDEIGEMPIHLQPKLLRFLQEKEYERVGESTAKKADVRIVAATNVDLEAAVAAGEFREDLLHRINTVTIHLPPLRHRGRDALEAAQRLLQDFNDRYGESKTFTDEALRALAARPWWGNFRELQNSVVRLAIFAANDQIDAADVERILGRPRPPGGTPLREVSPTEFVTHLAAVIDELIERFKQPTRLPIQPADEPNIFEDILNPLVFGRTLALAGGNATQAGIMIRKSKLDFTEGRTEARAIELYRNRIEPWIDEPQVQQTRRKQS